METIAVWVIMYWLVAEPSMDDIDLLPGKYASAAECSEMGELNSQVARQQGQSFEFRCVEVYIAR